MLKSKDHDRISKTNRVVTISWSDMGQADKRKQRWGGKIGAWDITKLDDSLYVIPSNIDISTIHDALMEVLAPSDRAAFTYPYGTNPSGSSAMTVRLYGKAAKAHKLATKSER